jgi:hypothetical protein
MSARRRKIAQLRISIGQAVHDLTLMAEVLSDEDLRNRVEFLPL